MIPPNPNQDPLSPDPSRFVNDDPAASSFVTGAEPAAGSSFVDGSDPTAAEGSNFVSGDNPVPGSSFVTEAGTRNRRRVALDPGAVVELKSNAYTVLEIISTGTGEATIYKVADNTGSVFALKLYYAFANPKEEPNPVTLERIRRIDSPFVLKLHDFGTGADKYQGAYCFEINEFAEGGDLLAVPDFAAQYTPEFLMRTVAPALLEGIGVLHANQIYHCDLKPSNVFYRDAARTQVCVGDYGSAQSSEVQYEENVSVIKSFKMTEQYTATELKQRGGLSEKADYYAAGMILLHLAYPQHFAQTDDPRRIDSRKYDAVVQNLLNETPVVPFDPRLERLNNLIAGLTRHYHRNRWGRPQAEQWRQGLKVIETGGTDRPIKLGHTTIRNEKDLHDFIENDPRWRSDLIDDRTTYEQLLLWVQERQHAGIRKTLGSVVEQARTLGNDYLRAALLRFFDPNRAVRVNGRAFSVFQTTEDHLAGGVSQTVATFARTLDDWWQRRADQPLAFPLFELEFALLQLRYETPGRDHAAINDALQRLYTAANVQSPPDEEFIIRLPQQLTGTDVTVFRRAVGIFYAFSPERPFRTHANQSLRSVEDVALYFAEHPSLYKYPPMRAERMVFLTRQPDPQWIDAELDAWLFAVFRNEVATHIDIHKVTLDSRRNHTVGYGFRKSLADFLRKHNADRNLVASLETTEQASLTVPPVSGMFASKNTVFDRFLAALHDKHNVGPDTITPEVAENARRVFKQKAVGNTFRLDVGEVIAAAAVLLPLLLWLVNDTAGVPLYENLFENSGLDLYTTASESYRQATGGLYHYWTVGGGALALASLAWVVFRFPTRHRNLSLAGAWGVWLMLGAVPTVYSFTNWLYVFWAVGMFLFVALVFWGLTNLIESAGGKQSGNGKQGLLLGVGIGVLGFSKFNYWSQPLADSGGIWDFYLYIGALAVLVYAATVYVLVRAYEPFSLLLKTAGVTVLAVLVLLIARPTFDVQARTFVPESDYEQVVSVAAANVRAEPSENAPVIGKLYRGTAVSIVDSVDTENNVGWYKINYNEQTGYVNRRLVKMQRKGD